MRSLTQGSLKKKWQLVEKRSIQAEWGGTHNQLVPHPHTHTPPSVPVPLRADHESQMAQALRTDELPGLVPEGDGGDGNHFFFLQYFFKMREIEFARGL